MTLSHCTLSKDSCCVRAPEATALPLECRKCGEQKPELSSETGWSRGSVALGDPEREYLDYETAPLSEAAATSGPWKVARALGLMALPHLISTGLAQSKARHPQERAPVKGSACFSSAHSVMMGPSVKRPWISPSLDFLIYKMKTIPILLLREFRNKNLQNTDSWVQCLRGKGCRLHADLQHCRQPGRTKSRTALPLTPQGPRLRAALQTSAKDTIYLTPAGSPGMTVFLVCSLNQSLRYPASPISPALAGTFFTVSANRKPEDFHSIPMGLRVLQTFSEDLSLLRQDPGEHPLSRIIHTLRFEESQEPPFPSDDSLPSSCPSPTLTYQLLPRFCIATWAGPSF